MTITKRDDQGRIVEKSLSSDEARRMAQQKKYKRKAELIDSQTALIRDAGYSMETAPEGLLLTAEGAAQGKPQMIVEYSRRWLSRVIGSGEVVGIDPPPPGAFCELCGAYSHDALSRDELITGRRAGREIIEALKQQMKAQESQDTVLQERLDEMKAQEDDNGVVTK